MKEFFINVAQVYFMYIVFAAIGERTNIFMR